LLCFAGHKVIREYYINDAGGQVDVLARSAHIRYLEALGEAVGDIPEGLYPGDYLVPVGQALAAEFGDRYRDAPESDWLVLFRVRAVAAMMVMIRADLALLGIHHDVFSSEAELQASGKPAAAEAWNYRCSARPGLAMTRTAQSANRMAGGPISAPIWPTIFKKPRPPTRLSISGVPITQARSSVSEPLWPRLPAPKAAPNRSK